MTRTKTKTITPVEPNSPRWDELVALGISKDADRNWTLGDIALEIAPMGDDHASNGALANLGLYAESIGVEFHSIRTYRDVSWAWADPNRIGSASWKVHQMFMAAAKRPILIDAAAKLGPGERITVTRAHELLNQSTAGRSGPRTIKQKAAVVKELLADHALGDFVATDPSLVTAIPSKMLNALMDHPKSRRVQAEVTTALTEEIHRRAVKAKEAEQKLAEQEQEPGTGGSAPEPDTEAENRRKAGEQYRVVMGQLQEVQSTLGAVDRRLSGELLVSGEPRAALLQQAEEIRTQVDLILLKLGKNITTADL